MRDVTDEATVAALLKTTLETLRACNVLINSAARQARSRLSPTSALDAWQPA
jgi:3-oxoacyl-[acyl-carrier protein] reductase